MDDVKSSKYIEQVEVPFVNCLSFANSPVSNISVSFSITSCSATHLCSSARVGSPGISSAEDRTASKAAKTSIGGNDSKNYIEFEWFEQSRLNILTLILSSIQAFRSLKV